MNKFSAILLDALEEMEFLTRTLNSAQLYYERTNKGLATMLKETRLFLLSATLDLAIDIEHKINHQIDKNNLVRQVNKNLNLAVRNIHYFPKDQKISSFDNIELAIKAIIDFMQEYSLNAYGLIEDFSLEEKKLLINKTLNIKSRRTI